jgi:SAM-dependent methyltransferase
MPQDHDPGFYDSGFYDDIDEMSRSSAAAIVPWLVAALAPGSVVDVGCGRGAWLAAFKNAGVDDILGLDGDYVDRKALHIDPGAFRAVDLQAPPDLGREFDLVVSLEVAEHLPGSQADDFVRFLTGLGPQVLFSGAAPGQGGVHHVNEQWPAYWADRFQSHGYRAVDVVRNRFWNDDRVAFYFAQNVVVYARHDVASHVASRLGPTMSPNGGLLPLVHPGMLDALRDQARSRRPAPPSVSKLLRALPGATRRAVDTRVKQFRQRTR